MGVRAALAAALGGAALLTAACGAKVSEFPAAPAPAAFPGDEALAARSPVGEVGPKAAGTPPAGQGATGGASGTAPANPSTTDPRRTPFAGRTYTVGECLTWSADPAGGSQTVNTVECSAAHNYEIVGAVDLAQAFGSTDRGYPSAQEWQAVIEIHCRALVESYLGHPLDPGGRFLPDAIGPSSDGWGKGERTLWCAVGARKTRLDRESGAPMVGPAKSLDQTLSFDPGTCIANDAATDRFSVVPCSTDHLFEVTLAVDLSARGSVRPTDAEWEPLMSPECAKANSSYLGRRLASNEHSFWFQIDEEAWSAGRRRTECMVAVVDAANHPTVVNHSLR